ncbi:claudin-7-like [Styela clava]|uniref:claudin-7-like n=1 Tax=Styela clava TaxID=7725 RepID=UPI00193A1AE0|nr:claudin-7-like [Styela clava]
MANGTLQLIGVLIACAGGLCTMVSTFLPDWRKNDPSGEVLESIIRHQGIWIRCISYPTGTWQCDDYDTFFIGLPQSLQIARGMSICANLFGFIGFLAAIFGLQCTTCIEGNQLVKNRVAMASGGFFLLSGVCIGVAASAFSHQILNEYMRFSNIASADIVGQRFVFGAALFIGWTGMAVTLLGGLIIMCGSCGESSPVTRYQRQSVRRVASLGRSVSMSFRRGRPERKQDPGEYV